VYVPRRAASTRVEVTRVLTFVSMRTTPDILSRAEIVTVDADLAVEVPRAEILVLLARIAVTVGASSSGEVMSVMR
jgi:hypothetical protein